MVFYNLSKRVQGKQKRAVFSKVGNTIALVNYKGTIRCNDK